MLFTIRSKNSEKLTAAPYRSLKKSSRQKNMSLSVTNRRISDPGWMSPSMQFSPTESSYVPIKMTKILPRLYLGSYDNANNGVEVWDNNITHVLSLIGAKQNFEVMRYLQVPMNDRGNTNLKEVLEKVSKFFEEGQQDGHNILVNCQCGQNRSATVVIALLMKNQKKNLSVLMKDQKKNLYNIHKELKRKRPIVQINVNYAKQLIELEKEILGESSLPSDWMERETFDSATGEVTYKHENMNTEQHRSLKLFYHEV